MQQEKGRQGRLIQALTMVRFICMILPFLEDFSWVSTKLLSLEISCTVVLASASGHILVLCAQGLAFTCWNENVKNANENTNRKVPPISRDIVPTLPCKNLKEMQLFAEKCQIRAQEIQLSNSVAWIWSPLPWVLENASPKWRS